jgi:transcriptional regulator with XRE-family HTH domain
LKFVIKYDTILSQDHVMDDTRTARMVFSVDKFGGCKMSSFIKQLSARRIGLGMSLTQLSLRSGVSLPTIQRILSGRSPAASFETVLAIARALEVDVVFTDRSDNYSCLRAHAQEKAKQLTRMLQGNLSLEAEGMDEELSNEIERRTTDELVAGSSRRIWS